MPTINKPAYPNPSTTQLDQKLDRMADALRQAAEADGSVKIEKLEQKVAATGDQALSQQLDAIERNFQRTERSAVTSSCSGTATSSCGGSATRDVHVKPKALDAAEVRSVFSALMDAKAKVGSLDHNADGHIAHDEAGRSSNLDGLSGDLAKGAVAGTLAAYEQELRAWNSELSKVATSIEARKNADTRMQDVAKHHAATPEASDAILWAYRELLVSAALGGADSWAIRDLSAQLDRSLKDAETSFLRFLPFFSSAHGAGHLDDAEVKRFLRTSDLTAFAADKKRAVENKVGGDFAFRFLGGKDLPGSEQLADPDFKKVGSSC